MLLITRALPACLALTLGLLPAANAYARGGADSQKCADTPDSEAAIAACTRLVEAGGLGAHNRAIVLGNRAAALKLLGRYDEAVADLARAIELDPDNPQYRSQRGDVLSRKQQYAEAIADYTKAIEVAPRNPWPHFGRGHAYLAQGNAELAAADFTEALRAKPDNINYLYFRGRANVQRKEYKAAEQDFSQDVVAA